MGNDKDRKIIGIQRFRDLMDSLEDIAEGQASDSDIQMSFEDEKKPGFRQKISDHFKKVISGTNFTAFLFHFFAYVYVRLRVIFVLISVAAEVFGGYFDNVKRFVVRHMFWGRGNLFKYAVQVVAVFLLIVIVVSRNYRAEALLAVEAASSQAEENVNNLDLIVQNSTTKTQSPEGKGARIEPEDYVVKSGDTLSTIAQNFEVSVETIQWENDLSAASVIRPGMKLRIPPADGLLYTVKKGDTLDSIVKYFKSKKQDTNSQVIADINGLLPPFDLVAGTELMIPDVRPPTIIATATTSFSGTIRTSGAPSWSANYIDPNVGKFLTTYPVASGILVTQCPSRYHVAFDFSNSSMPDIVAAADGVINFAGCHSGSCPAAGRMIGGYGYAWAVEIDHGNGYTTLYAHLNKIYVTKGQRVKAGTHIGQMGRSGTATGVHLHFELWKGQKYNRVNPYYYFASGVQGSIGRSCGY